MGIAPVIFHRENWRARHDPATHLDFPSYRQQFVLEQTVGWPSVRHRIGTRFIMLAIIRLHLREHISDTY